MNQDSALPKSFIERLKKIVPPDQYQAVLANFALKKPVTFRINSLKTTRNDLIAELHADGLAPKPITGYTQAFMVANTQRELLTASAAFRHGRLYIQGLASMLAPLALNPKPGEEILDLAAAPGGKTCQIADMMQNKGRIAAVEKSKTRFFKLKNNIETLGVTCVDLYLKDGGEVWRSCENRFDRVLLDAPCSSEARFDVHEPKTLHYWSEKKIKEMARKQWRLIYSAFRSLKLGGVLVYSTCSFAPEENELIIARLLKRFKQAMQIDKINLPINNIQPGLSQWQGKSLDATLKNCVRILPNDAMTGFFICRIVKRATT